MELVQLFEEVYQSFVFNFILAEIEHQTPNFRYVAHIHILNDGEIFALHIAVLEIYL